MDKNQYTTLCCLQETHFTYEDTQRLKMKGQKMIFHANGNKKRAKVAILVSDKIEYKSRMIKNKGHYIISMGSIQQEDLTNINTSALNTRTPRYRKKILIDQLKEEMNYS